MSCNRLGTKTRHVRGRFCCQSVERLEQPGAVVEVYASPRPLEGLFEERKQSLRKIVLSDVRHSVPRVLIRGVSLVNLDLST
jgi:hypothetical protein